MKNFKKLFASVAVIAMLASSVPTTVLGAASYSDELQGAYDYAYGMGVTTQSAIDTADMYGQLKRSHMAKMMVNYAKEVKGMTADTSLACSFTDVANQTEEMQGYIKEACQMGLMGQGITAFNPNGIVTRAQFGTVLSRVLYGDANNGGNPYYADHLAALKDAGIMTNISNPNAPEVRGYVMLMMQRADNGTTPAVCSTPENVLSCSLGLDTCPSECQTNDTEVKAGSLSVSLNSNSAANGTQVPSTGTVKFAVVDFTANSSDVSLKTVELKKVGLASVSDAVGKVWFEKNGVRVSGKATFTSEGIAVISFAPAYVVKAGEKATFDLYVELNTTEGQDFQFASDTISTTAEQVNGSFTTPKLRTAKYTVAPITIALASTGSTYNAATDAVELGAFTIANNDASSETRDVEFKSIAVRQNGNADLTNLSNIVLVRNGVVVGKNPTINGKDLTFTVGDTVKDGATATYYIKAIIDTVDTTSDTYQFAVRYTTDVNAVESISDFRSTVTGTPTLGLYTVKGGDVTFAKDSSIELSSNYAAGSENVILMKGTITTKNAITLEDVTLTGNNTGLSNLFSTIYLQIGSSTLSYSPSAGEKVAKFLGTVTVNGSASVKMYAKLKDTATAQSVKFEDMKLGSFTTAEYVSNSNSVSSYVGSIAGVSVTVQTSTLNITRNDALGNQTIAKGTNGLLTYGLSLTSDQGNGANVSNAVFTITSNNTAELYNNAYVTLYVNGVAKGSKTIQGTTVSFDSFNVDVTKTNSATIQLKADFADAFTSGNVQFTLSSLNVIDKLTSKEVTSYSKPAGAVFTVASAAGTIAASDNNPQAQLFLSPSTAQKLLAFKLTAKNDDVRLYNVNFTGTNLDGLSNFRIIDATGTVIATANTASASALTFTQIANAPKVLKDKSETYYVVADVNSNTTLTTLALTLTSTDVKGSNGLSTSATGTVTSKTHATAENTLVIAKAANTSKLLTTSALRFTVTAAGKDTITLSGVDFSNAVAGYTGTIVLKVYKNSVSSANIAGTLNAKTGLVTLTANNTVDAGNTVTYVVVLDGAIIDSQSNSQDWSVSLTNVQVGTMNSSAYDNVASFPITETK